MTTSERRPARAGGEEAQLLAKIEDSPEQLSSYRRLGRLQESRGRCREAVETLCAALEQDPKDRETKMLLAQVYENSSRLDEAEQVLRGLIRGQPDHFPFYERLGRILKKQGCKLDVTAVLARVRPGNPCREQALKQLVLLHKEAGKIRTALKWVEKLIAEFGEDFSRVKDRARFLDRLGRGEEAVEAYRRARDLDPANSDVILLEGIALKRLERRVEARKVFAELAALAKGFYGGNIQLAEMDIEDGDIESARARLRRLEARWPGNSRVNLNFARISLLEGRPGEALESALSSHRQTPFYYTEELALGFGLIADASGKLGKREDAAVYRLLAREVGRGGDFFQILSSLARKLLKKKKPVPAERVADEMLNRFPDNSLASAWKAEALLARDRHEEARRFAERAAGESDPRYLRDRIHGMRILGEIHRRRGSPAEADRIESEIAGLQATAR